MHDPIKILLNWFYIKLVTNKSNHKPPEIHEGEIWWTRIGENIGKETRGKGRKFTRPVLVLKKYSRHSFFGLPLSTKTKKGSWYHEFYFNNKLQNCLLSQGRSMSYKRLNERIGKIGNKRLEIIRDDFMDLHKIDPPPTSIRTWGSRIIPNFLILFQKKREVNIDFLLKVVIIYRITSPYTYSVGLCGTLNHFELRSRAAPSEAP
jgi:mRNA interferase MazF